MKRKKIMTALLAGILLMQYPVGGWAAQDTADSQKTEADQTQETQTADGTEEGSEETPILQAENDEITLDTGSSNNEIQREGKILDHVYVENVDLSGMTKEEAQDAVQNRVDEITGYQIVLHMDDMSAGVTAKELGVTGNNDGAIEQALSIGQVGNVVKRYKIKKELEQESLQLDLSFQVNTDTLRNALEQYCVPLNREVVDYSLTRENGTFQITNGVRGVTLKEDDSVDKVEDYLEHVWKDGPGNVELDVEITEPKGSQEELSRVKDVLGQGSTDYSASSAARATNVKNGTSKLNGKVLYPGDEISVCDNMVPFTEENGYEPAASYANGTVVESFGGGICQVSTTLYQAVLQAELEVTERHNHSMIVKYVEPSMDAAIAEGAKDFRFVNNTQAPVYIEGYVSGGKIYFTLYGEEYRSADRKVTYESETLETIDPTTELTADTEKAFGSMEQTQSAHTGYKARLWKVVTENGQQVSREEVNNSYYQMTPNKYKVGVKTSNTEAASAMYTAIANNDLNQVYVVLNKYGG